MSAETTESHEEYQRRWNEKWNPPPDSPLARERRAELDAVFAEEAERIYDAEQEEKQRRLTDEARLDAPVRIADALERIAAVLEG